MRKIKILMMLVISLCFLLTSCGGFFAEQSLEIAAITSTTLEDGSTQVVISYTDEEITPTTFIIPKGVKGESGNGIKNVTYDKSDDGKNTIVTIEFTDEAVEPVSISLPNGVSIDKIEGKKDSLTEETNLTIYYSDGTKSDPISIPKGEKGEDGISIIGISQRINRDYSVTLTLEMSKGDNVIVEIPSPQQGKDGRGIKDIVSIPNGDKYVMTITYTDDTSTDLEFARPNKWFSESSEPTILDGINGDLWYDLAHQVIYVKQNNKWEEVIDFGNVKEDTYEVTFNLNDSTDAKASMPAGSLLNYQIPCGTYFNASGFTIPVPTRNGYTFVGWCTSRIPTPVSGYFNDLTIVQSDLVLYAIWEEVK